MQRLRLCVFVAFIATIRAYELSQKMAEFYCVFNGNFNDSAQIERDGSNRTSINLRLQPVYAPALSEIGSTRACTEHVAFKIMEEKISCPDPLGTNKDTNMRGGQFVNSWPRFPVPAWYAEESSGGVLVRALIGILTEGEGDIIYMDTYNFTGNSDIRPGTFDANKIKSLSREDLHGQPDCRSVFERDEPFVFTVNYPNCKEPPVNGQRLSYGVTETCTQLHIIMPSGAPEKPTLVPYTLKLESGKYPLENAPINYVCNCE